MSEEKEGHSQSEDKKKGGQGLLIGIGAAIIVLLLVVIAILLFRQGSGEAVQNEPDQSRETVRGTVVTKENAEQVVEDMSKSTGTVDPGYFETSMTNEWHFTLGGKVSDAYVANVESNANDVYFDLVLAEDESKVLYKSPVITRGAVLENFALDTTLEAGTYNCVVIYHMVDADQNTLGTLRIAVTAIVEQ